jgi:ATP:ADP antiporter, AAA family
MQNALITRLSPWVWRLARIEDHEVGAALVAFVSFMCLQTAYNMLRPVRETMGITSGVTNLPALFWAVFVGMVLVQPVFGWLSARHRRTQFVPWIFAFLAANLLGFYAWFLNTDDHTWIARALYVWLSVTNLFSVSVFWSLMVDVFRHEQGRRLFGFISAGASTGGILGPLLTAELALRLGTIHLLPIAATLLLLTPLLLIKLSSWQRRTSAAALGDVEQAVGGSIWAGFTLLLRQRELLGLSAYVITLGWLTTFLYLQQAELVQAEIATIDARTQFFARLDLAVQVISLLVQLFVINRLVHRLGLAGVLALIPALLVPGCAALALHPSLALLAGVMIVRRVGEYSISKPSREMLFTDYDRETKYKAKNLIDTAITRSADATGGSVYTGLIKANAHEAMLWLAAGIAALAAGVGYVIGLRHARDPARIARPTPP